MVNIFNSWAQLVEFVQHFAYFMFGYAYKAIGVYENSGSPCSIHRRQLAMDTLDRHHSNYRGRHRGGVTL